VTPIKSRELLHAPSSDGIFVPIDEHAISLVAILTGWPEPDDWSSVAEWLAVAGSIERVSLNFAKLNPDFGWCSEADKFDMARKELLTDFVRDMTLFSFCWGALEAALKIIEPPRQAVATKRGRIREACYYLREKFSTHSALVGLDCALSRFRVAARSCLGSERVERRFIKELEFGSQGVGLYAVYELRNDFAHGSLNFPMPDEENNPISDDSAMVQSASRIVLLQLQMLLLAFSGDAKIDTRRIDCYFGGFDKEGVPLDLALRGCHLADATSEFQLPLGLDEADRS
jgi:hypothetical protein